MSVICMVGGVFCFFSALISGGVRIQSITRHPRKKNENKNCAAGVVTGTNDRDSLRYTYNGTRRVRQLALGCESN